MKLKEKIITCAISLSTLYFFIFGAISKSEQQMWTILVQVISVWFVCFGFIFYDIITGYGRRKFKDAINEAPLFLIIFSLVAIFVLSQMFVGSVALMLYS